MKYNYAHAIVVFVLATSCCSAHTPSFSHVSEHALDVMCDISVAGHLENCTILSPTDPKTAQNMLGFLKTLRYGPAIVHGVAVRQYHHTMHVTYTKG
ncbi:hypothetical protein [Neokomagataea anthophila]|uniref:Uncharacterized protein n=1 Tax=Neokomagataea anthophila TaxID=2826925 RepID=A0ABS5E5G0_9PROT|nr:hypothetical protein [Neokomagataea anthophila]MBR0559135.1 hypothetical protein [Neokomagataea anthophila]